MEMLQYLIPKRDCNKLMSIMSPEFIFYLRVQASPGSKPMAGIW